MAEKEFNLSEYMAGGVENLVKGAIRATLKDPKESIFMAKFARSSRESTKRRAEFEAQGEHIPPFLIASITSSCNLHCAGCYARENHACNDEVAYDQLTADEWGRIFEESRDLGIGFILLAGGEPMMRKDVLQKAAEYPEILFPVFTNGTMMNDNYIKLFDSARNLVPILSIEGDELKTDERRGNGIYQLLIKAMDKIKSNNLIFGASVTVTTSNINEVVSEEFLTELSERGCKAVIYVEFVPVTDDSTELAPGDSEREFLRDKMTELREKYQEMIFVSFPGDEKATGGCLAAGRGFFHINSHGGAEPCPFSPYSDISVKDTSVREALHSKLFTDLQSGDVLVEDHAGGCVLFERRDKVVELLNSQG
ncbi:MAG: radical SAM protein [Ruminococcus sp.]|nr:radical SAM protein [Ruminococcus sp.]